MVGHGLSPTWKKRSRSDRDGQSNKITCTHLFNSRSMLFTEAEGSVWTDDPAYVPLSYNSSYSELKNDDDNPSGFYRMLVPGVLRAVTLKINGNGIAHPFSIWLAEDGPVYNDSDPTFSGPRLIQKLISVPLNTDPAYTTRYFPDNLYIELFSGHSYGYYFKLEDPAPTLPTVGTLSFVLTAMVYFGAGGN